jgi:hypothetical protein
MMTSALQLTEKNAKKATNRPNFPAASLKSRIVAMKLLLIDVSHPTIHIRFGTAL